MLYVIILSAALDLVGPGIPKGSVLLFDVIPSFLVKLTAPYYIHTIPYRIRILIFVALSTCGMLLIALTPSSVSANSTEPSVVPDRKEILTKMGGVVLASLSSGGGELSFLGLTHYYGRFSLASWGSGTGGAGLIGAGAYVIATTTLRLSVRTSLLAFSFLPVVMLLSFFLVLPPHPALKREGSYQSIPDAATGDEVEDDLAYRPQDGLLSQRSDSASSHTRTSSMRYPRPALSNAWASFKANIHRAKGLFLP